MDDLAEEGLRGFEKEEDDSSRNDRCFMSEIS